MPLTSTSKRLTGINTRNSSPFISPRSLVEAQIQGVSSQYVHFRKFHISVMAKVAKIKLVSLEIKNL